MALFTFCKEIFQNQLHLILLTVKLFSSVEDYVTEYFISEWQEYNGSPVVYHIHLRYMFLTCFQFNQQMKNSN